MITKKLKIEKVGRKWLECKDEYNKVYKVEINDVVKEIINNEEITVHGNYEDKSNRYGVDRRITNVLSEDDYNNYLEAQENKKESDKLKKTIETAISAINKMMYYIETNIEKYWYKNGETVIVEKIAELKELKVDVSEYENKLAILKEKFANAKYENKTTNIKSTFVTNEYYEVNSIIKYDNKYIKITSYKETTLSRDEVEAVYGGCFADDDESFYSHRNSYTYTYVEASAEERETVIKKEEEKLEKQLLKTEKEEAEKQLLNYINNNSTKEEKSNDLENNINNAKEIIKLNNIKSIRTDEISNVYLLTSNWSDYDNWDYNNCDIGICMTCKLTSELQVLLNNVLKYKIIKR